MSSLWRGSGEAAEDHSLPALSSACIFRFDGMSALWSSPGSLAAGSSFGDGGDWRGFAGVAGLGQRLEACGQAWFEPGGSFASARHPSSSTHQYPLAFAYAYSPAYHCSSLSFAHPPAYGYSDTDLAATAHGHRHFDGFSHA
jgi:hypothetical protein